MIEKPAETATIASVEAAIEVFLDALLADAGNYVSTPLDGEPSQEQLDEIRREIRKAVQLDALIGFFYNRATARWELGVINTTPTL